MGENKKDIVEILSILMKVTRSGYDLDRLELSEDGGEVTVRYHSGYEKRVNVECDSGAALILDVVNAML
ncbi:MAG: hypothetical protein HFI60_08610 [Lachnospiraceae bacterium]|jgi:hypothetical protein|nr:hypothetical protein [Lachnospiraceae bacterium]